MNEWPSDGYYVYKNSRLPLSFSSFSTSRISIKFIIIVFVPCPLSPVPCPILLLLLYGIVCEALVGRVSLFRWYSFFGGYGACVNDMKYFMLRQTTKFSTECSSSGVMKSKFTFFHSISNLFQKRKIYWFLLYFPYCWCYLNFSFFFYVLFSCVALLFV